MDGMMDRKTQTDENKNCDYQKLKF